MHFGRVADTIGLQKIENKGVICRYQTVKELGVFRGQVQKRIPRMMQSQAVLTLFLADQGPSRRENRRSGDGVRRPGTSVEVWRN